MAIGDYVWPFKKKFSEIPCAREASIAGLLGGVGSGAASIIITNQTKKSMAMGPSVRNLLAHYKLDPARIASTGPHQTLIKGDVLSYINQHQLTPGSSQANSTQSNKPYVPNLDISGFQPKPGPDGFSRVAKQLLDM